MERKFFQKLKNHLNKISLLNLFFILLCFVGCFYQVIQVSHVYFKYSTKIDVTIDTSSQIVVPLVSFCKKTDKLFKTSIKGSWTPAKIYNNSYDLSDVFFHCKIQNNHLKLVEVGNCTNLKSFGVKMDKTVNDKYICYHFKHPQFSKNISRVIDERIYSFLFYQFDQTKFWLYLSWEQLIATGRGWMAYGLAGKIQVKNNNYYYFIKLGGRHYVIAYTRCVTHLLPAPYATNCVNYSKIGCQSKSACIDKCHVEHNLNECNVLPSFVNMDKSNDKDIYDASKCKDGIDKSVCEKMFQSDDCFMEHYIMKTVIDNVLEDKDLDFLSKNYSEYNSNLVTSIEIVFNNNPDTIYTHSPQQYFVEFACYIGSVIALWFGISVMSLYAYGKMFLLKNITQIKESKFNQKRQKISLERNAKVRLNQIVNLNHDQGYGRNLNENIFSTYPF